MTGRSTALRKTVGSPLKSGSMQKRLLTVDIGHNNKSWPVMLLLLLQQTTVVPRMERGKGEIGQSTRTMLPAQKHRTTSTSKFYSACYTCRHSGTSLSVWHNLSHLDPTPFPFPNFQVCFHQTFTRFTSKQIEEPLDLQ